MIITNYFKRFGVLVFIGVLINAGTVSAQNLPDSTVARVDKLFARWKTNEQPGCVAGIVINDRLVYNKGFGLANLETGAFNTPETNYYMCSVSKQFTGNAIAWLVAQGKINLDADIHTYLPKLKDFGAKITVGDLLHHTSGIRDDIYLAQFYGLNLDGMLTQDAAMKILYRQHTLNFEPGQKFSYSNSNYVLLAEIVKEVSGRPFSKFVDSVIFKPLAIKSAGFIDDPAKLIPGRASSYTKEGDVWKNSVHNVYTMGDGGLFINAIDMAKWVANFWPADSMRKKVIGLMTTPGKLADGKPITYAMGIDVNTHREQKRLIHNGGLAGYRTMLIVYPELKMGFFVFGNGADREVPNMAYQMADMFVPQKAESITRPAATVAPAPITIDSVLLKKFAGDYISANGFRLDITLKNGHLFIGKAMELAATTNALFYAVSNPALKLEFSTTGLKFSSPVVAQPIFLKKAGPDPKGDKQLADYLGTYYSDELDFSFTIKKEGNKTILTNPRLGTSDIKFKGTEHLLTNLEAAGHLLVRRDEKNRIIGFDVNNGDLMNLFFKKQ